MISNSTTSLESKSNYTSAERQKPAANAPSTQSDPVSVAVPVEKEDPVAAPVKERETDKPDGLQQQREELSRRIAEAIPKVRELMQKNQRSLDFEVAETENRVIITVIDKETEKVIRQIPPEDVLQIAEAIDQGLEQGLGGFMLNSRA
ncbi:MAG: flagellar protein FlaG [Gammaproteobacteria bacterium]|jgi:flagellar protein FlaG